MDDIRAAIESVFLGEAGRIIASLIRISGSFDLAEEAMQESFAAAWVAWQSKGIPENPAGWIIAAGHRKLIDRARKERTRRDKQESLKYEWNTAASTLPAPFEATPVDLPDDRLSLMFTCCHPAINQEAQVALTLRTLGGLSTSEIAKAFLVPEATLAQRLVRAKRKIQEAHIPYEVPPPERMLERLAPVRTVIYLIFNEGYAATTGASLVRKDLCTEAIRLGRLLCASLSNDSESLGLLALMLLQDSRRNTRVAGGVLVTLENQDRSLWDRTAIEEGVSLLETALASGKAGPYQLQAAIAAVHAQAPTSSQTDWLQIAALYGKLLEMNPSPVIELNRAVAVAMGRSLQEGLQQIDELSGARSLDGYYLFHAARADLLRRLNRNQEASEAYCKAVSLASNPIEVQFLKTQLSEIASKI
jgi:RNA polymerase sigma-70 factor (ECF subfamily)